MTTTYKPPLAANDNHPHEGPSIEWKRRWAFADAHGAFLSRTGKKFIGPRLPSEWAQQAVKCAANVDYAAESPTGKQINQHPIMERARDGKLCPDALAALQWLENILDDAIADPAAIPSASWGLSPDDFEAAYNEETGQYEKWAGFQIDREPTYGPRPDWMVERADKLILPTRNGRLIAVGLPCIDERTGRPFTYWQSVNEGADRAKGSDRTKKRPLRDDEIKGENDPKVTWTRQMHSTGGERTRPVPTPPPLYRALAQGRIAELRRWTGDDRLAVLVKAVFLRQTSTEVGAAPGVSHDRARVAGNKLIEDSVTILADYWRDNIQYEHKRAA